MKFMRCKCGESHSWTTMGSPLCRVCPKCGTTLAEGPSGHLDPQPHEWTTKYDPNTGEPRVECLNCRAPKPGKEPR